MSYPPYQGQQGQPPYAGYGQGPPGPYPPPQQGYGAPPPGYQGQHHGGQQPPQQHGYGAPAGYPPQPQYGQQHQAYPPQQQQQGYPPQQQYGQSSSAYPPQGYGNPPPGQYPPTQQYPPQGGYGGQAPQYGGAVPAPPSEGYGSGNAPPIDATFAIQTLRKAMKGFGTDEAALIRTLCHYPASQIGNLKTAYQCQHNRSLEKDIISETGGYFEAGLCAILRGPLHEDVHILHEALSGAGTNEDLLNDVLIGRSNADLAAIKAAYENAYRKPLAAAVSGDLSAKTERLFAMIVAAHRNEESAPAFPQAVEADVTALHRATEEKMGTHELEVCAILTNRSDGQIRAIAHAYEAKYARSLEKVIASEFSGHMKAALLQIVQSAVDRPMRDATRLEDCMSGAGTKDEMLVARVVQMHWNRDHMQQVRRAYQVKYKKDLVARIKGGTSGDYERLLVAMVE